MVRRRHRLLVLPLAALILTACFEPTQRSEDGSGLLHTRHGAFDPVAAPPALLPSEDVHNVAVDGRVPYLVQFRSTIHPSWRDAIRARGIEVQSYFPENALLVRAHPEAASALRALPFVRAVLEQAPLLRLDPDLLARLEAPWRPEEGDAATEVLVELVDATHLTAVIQAIQTHGGEVTEAVADSWLIRARVPAAATRLLAARSDVAFVGPAPTLRLFNDDSRWVVQSGITQSRRTPIWDHGLLGEGQIVAVADTGLHVDSCFFAGDDKVVGYQDFGSTGIGDPNGHGTHVAGSIAGDRLANGAYDTHDGMAPAARLFIQDLGAYSWGGLRAVPSDLGRLLGPAYDRGARLHNNSWGSDDSRYDSLARSLDVWVANNPDMLVLVAAGNSGPSSGTVGTPATAKNVIAVGAARGGTSANEIASFSSRGPTADGRLKPLLTAPGQSITSALTGQDCSVTRQSGTSMASPTLAGVAALARQYFMAGYYPSGRARQADAFEPSAALLKATLVAGAQAMTGSSAGTFPNQTQGFGRVNLDDSLYFEGDAASRRLWVAEEPSGLAVGEEATFELEVQSGGDLKIALTWTDLAGATGSSLALVNDLDLVVEGPQGTFHGNVFANGQSQVGAEVSDRRNVEELVFVPGAPAGLYRVRVVAHNVPQGRQAFALAAVGAISVDSTGTGSGGEVGDDDPPATDPTHPTDPVEPDPDTPPPVECEVHEVSPRSGQVGWVRSNDTQDPHFIGDRSIYAGWWNQQTYLCVVQFDLDLQGDGEIEWVHLALTGRTSEYLNGGTFIFDVVDLPRLDGSTTYGEIAQAEVRNPSVASLQASQVGAYVENVLSLPVASVSGGTYTLRVRGQVTTHSVMGWDSGHGEGGLGIPPVLSVCVKRPPLSLEALGDQVVLEGETLAFSLGASGGEGDAVAFGAEALPEGASLDTASGAFAWTPDFGQRGEYTVAFFVTDGVQTVTESVRITVLPANRPPVLEDPGELKVVEEDLLSVQLRATDPDGDAIVFYGEALPAGATVSESGQLSWRPERGQAGTYDVTLVATDGSASDSVQVSIVVLPEGSALDGDHGEGRGVGFGCATGTGAGGAPLSTLALVAGLLVALRRRRRGR
jgi:hypothetical protein